MTKEAKTNKPAPEIEDNKKSPATEILESCLEKDLDFVTVVGFKNGIPTIDSTHPAYATQHHVLNRAIFELLKHETQGPTAMTPVAEQEKEVK